MSELLSIDTIAVTRLPGTRTALIPDNSGEAAYFAIRLTVTNHSADTTLHMTTAITELAYESRSRTLSVGFRSPELAPESRRRPLAVEHVPLNANTTTVVEARIASPITYLEPASGARREPRYVFVDHDVDEFECTLTYTDTPPPARINLAVRGSTTTRTWHTAKKRWSAEAEAQS
jgi:hypothetical protein